MKEKNSEKSSTAPKRFQPGEQMIVGIGASAGGIKALKQFFENVPEETGITYVVILHLSPDHDSKLAEVLSYATSMKVLQVTEKTKALPNQVYVIPPNMHLQMEDGSIAVLPHMNIEDRRAPVDIFFRTLAESHGPAAVCVILSGTGANGSMGLKRVKEKGGASFVQNPLEAEYSEMPRNAIATELVDEVLPVAEIPGKIMEYLAGLRTVHIPDDPEENAEEQKKALAGIFKQLRFRTGHDFTNYKRPTLLRRIERRMNIHAVYALGEYAAFLESHVEENTALLKDLLISVTNFFRDKKAFEFMESDLLSNILKNKKNEQQVRIWVAGCATGEEAYSIAMLVSEKLFGVPDAPRVQIFATDIDEAAITHAREGLYSINDAADVSPERMSQFFSKEGERYRVKREIREMILFAHHNFLKDPPFSHLDLVSCRNVMIYLNHVAQQRVLNTFHFALNPGAFLFLGTSESVDGLGDLFASYQREFHVFQTKQASYRPFPLPESVPSLRIETPAILNQVQHSEKRTQERINFSELHQRLLEEYAPPSVVINEDYEMLHLSESAGRYFQISGGEVSQNLLKLVLPEIRMELRSGLYRARQQQAVVEIKGIRLITGEPGIINMTIRPVLKEQDPVKGFFLIIFEQTELQQLPETRVINHNEPHAQHLEEENLIIKQQLRNSIEQHEFQAEELKASNEELQAMNEELRSAAEELETSKEELQSINEELRAVNQELKIKIDETTLSENNLRNLTNSVDIGSIFLDKGFKVNLFTPAARNIFNLLPSDFGRPITDITNKLLYDHLLDDVEIVLQKLQSTEREVETTDKKTYIMKLSPYRTSDDRINGVVISFVEITERRQSERALEESENRFRTLTDVVPQVIWANDAKGKANYFNRRWYEYTGLSYEQSYELGWEAIVHPDDEPASAAKWTAAKAGGHTFDTEYRLRKSDGSYRWFIGRNVPLKNDQGDLIGWFGSATDIDDIKCAEQELQESEARLRATMESATAYAIITLNAAGIIEEWNPGAEKAFGYKKNEAAGKSFDLIFTPEDIAADIPRLELETAIRDGKADDERWHIRRDGTRFYMSGIISPISDGQVTGFVKVARDLTDEKFAAEALRVSEERYRVALESAGMAAWDWNLTDDTVLWNHNHFTMLGAAVETKKINSEFFLQFVYWQDKDHVRREMEKAAETGEYSASFRIIRQNDEQLRWMRGFGRVVERKDGQPTRMVGVMYDITDQKALEKQKEDFIGIAGHELKTPVTSIKAYADVLQEMLQGSQEKKAAEIATRLNMQVERLSELIRTVLDTTKISEGLLPLSKQSFDINLLIAEKISLLQPISEAHHIVFAPAQKSSPVKADAERIGQVLTNLISNAMTYSEKGTAIVIETASTEKEISVRVTDSGIGISAEAQAQIFEKFFRIQNGKPLKYPGMGLGLFISMGIIQRHGGTLSVQSEPGKGSVFTFTLPFEAKKLKQ